MIATPRYGIRYTSDLTGEYSEYVIDSVDLLNLQLAPHGMSFFFDTIDVHQQIIGGKHCWDMFGWAIPNDEVSKFGRFGWPARTRSLKATTAMSVQAGRTATVGPMPSSTAAFSKMLARDRLGTGGPPALFDVVELTSIHLAFWAVLNLLVIKLVPAFEHRDDLV